MNKEGWEIKKLGEVCDVRDGTHDSPKYQIEGFPLITSKHLTSGEINFENVNLISREDFENINRRSKVDIGDILMPMIGTIGNPIIVKTSKMFAIKNVALIKFKPSCEVLNGFIHSLLKSNLYSEKLLSLNKGGTQKFIALGTIRNFPIPIPPLPIQEQIIKELDTLSDIIAKKKEQLAELDTLAQATFYDMFGDPVDNEKGWDISKLRDVCDVRDGTHDSPKYQPEGYPLITSKNLTEGVINFNNINLISKIDFDNINKRSKVDIGDILMPMIGTIGNPVIVQTSREFAIKNVALIKFNFSSKVSNIYISNALNSKSYFMKLMSMNKGGTQKFIALGTIRDLKIPIPPLPLQNQFAERIEAIEKQKELINKSIVDVQLLFDYTMDKYFN